jgi:hypothetical protein
VYEPQIRIVKHDHITVITWLSTHIIVHGSKRSNLRKSTFILKIQLFVLTKNLTKQLVLIAKGILKLAEYKGRLMGDESSLTSESKMCHEDLPMRQRPVKSFVLRLVFSSFSKLEESSLEKSRSLRAAHTRDISSRTSSSCCPRSSTSSCSRPCRWSCFGCCSCTYWRSRTSSAWGSRR